MLSGFDGPGGDVDVVVIGAGVSGLACAAILAGAGRSVVVLEAGSRIGGRIRSHHSPSGAVWELGAQVRHDTANPVWQQFDPAAQLEPFADSDFRTLLGGRSLPLAALTRLGMPPWMVVPSLAAVCPAVAGSPVHFVAGLPAPARRIALDWLGQDWAGDPAGFDVPEMLQIASAVGALGNEAVVQGGWDHLPARLASGLDIRLATPVRRLALDGDQVVLHTDHGVARATAAVLAVPPWTARTGALELAGLPMDKRAAADGLVGGDAVVAVVHTTAVAPQTVSVFDADRGWGFLRAQRGHRDIQIVAKGPGAGRLRAALGATAATGIPAAPVAVELTGVLGAALPWTAGADIISVTIADWGADPFIGGAFTSPAPGRARHSAAWARPWADTVFFAGESCSGARGIGRVHGALSSGLRAAEEVLTAVPGSARAQLSGPARTQFAATG